MAPAFVLICLRTLSPKHWPVHQGAHEARSMSVSHRSHSITLELSKASASSSWGITVLGCLNLQGLISCGSMYIVFLKFNYPSTISCMDLIHSDYPQASQTLISFSASLPTPPHPQLFSHVHDFFFRFLARWV